MDNLISAHAMAAQIDEFRRSAATENAAAAILENQAAKKREKATTLIQCADDLASVLSRLESIVDFDADGLESRKDQSRNAGKVRLRYQEEGLTTDIISMIFNNPGIAEAAVLQVVQPKEKSRGTARKMIRRAVDCKDIQRNEGNLSLTEQGKAMWRQSPLFILS